MDILVVGKSNFANMARPSLLPHFTFPSDIPPLFEMYLKIAKMHIYCSKFQNIVHVIGDFPKRIADMKHIEKYITVKKNKKNTSIQSKMVNVTHNCSIVIL